MDLALGATLAEAARDQDAVHVLEMADRVVTLENLRVHPFHRDLHVAAEAAMGQRLGQRLVGVEKDRVLADHGDRHLALGLADRADDAAPAVEVRFGVGLEAEIAADLAIESLLVVGNRHLVDGVDVARLDHALGPHVAEQGDLAALVGRDLLVAAAAYQQVGLDADAQQLLDRMLGRLGLQFARSRHPRQKSQVHVHYGLAAELVADLADGFEERQAFDVAHGAADLDQDEILLGRVGQHEFLDRVGDVRDHLHRGAEIVAAAFAGDDGRVDATGRDVVALPRVDAGEALVVPEIEIGLRAVIGHENLAMLVRTHRPRIDVEVRVELAQPNPIAAALKQGAQRC